jgi:hypothetical protein
VEILILKGYMNYGSMVFFMVFLIILFISCSEIPKYKEEIQTAISLIDALQKSDTIKINDLTGVSPNRIGEDSFGYNFKIKATSRFLNVNEISKKESFIIKEYPENSPDLIDILIPIFDKITQEEKGKVIVRFVKFLPSSKIAFFQLDSKFSDKIILAPE